MTSPLLVTGAGGFRGAAVVRHALRAGYEVAALSRTPLAERLRGLPGKLTTYAVDLADHAAVARTLEGIAPAALIHCAWEGVGGTGRAGNVQLDNIRATVALADAAIAAGARKFVGVGSQAEYGRYDRAIVESDLPCPTMLYGAAEAFRLSPRAPTLRRGGRRFCLAPPVFSLRQRDNPNRFIPSVAAALADAKVPRCTPGTQLWDYLHIDDAAAGALAAAVTADATGVFNLSSGRPVAVRAILKRLRDRIAPRTAAAVWRCAVRQRSDHAS